LAWDRLGPPRLLGMGLPPQLDWQRDWPPDSLPDSPLQPLGLPPDSPPLQLGWPRSQGSPLPRATLPARSWPPEPSWPQPAPRSACLMQANTRHPPTTRVRQ